MLGRTIPLALVWSCVATASMADAISDWNEKTVAFVTARQLPPPQAERVMAMVHAAMFDAVNSIERRYRPAIAQVPASEAASKDAAAAAAAASVLAGLYPEATELKDATATYLATVADGEAKSAGLRVGEAMAAQVLEARAKDGSHAVDAYRPKTKPGVYVPTALTVGSTWVDLKPFVLKSSSQFRPQPPLPLSGEQWANDYNEIKRLGSRTSTQRTAKQTGRSLLARARALNLLSGGAPSRSGQKTRSRRQRAFHGTRCARPERRVRGGLRRQISLRPVAPDHGHQEWRHRRQS